MKKKIVIFIVIILSMIVLLGVTSVKPQKVLLVRKANGI